MICYPTSNSKLPRYFYSLYWWPLIPLGVIKFFVLQPNSLNIFIYGSVESSSETLHRPKGPHVYLL